MKKINYKDDKIKDLRNAYKRNRYGNKYKFDNDMNILKSFETIFNANDIPYNPHKKTKETQVRYLLHKLENDTWVDKNCMIIFIIL